MKFARPGQPLIAHANNVGTITRHFTEQFNAGTWGELIGRFHDIGKFPAAWQHYMLENSPKITHAPEAAAEIMRILPSPLNYVAAYCIYGHHVSLPDYSAGLDRLTANHQLSEPLTADFIPDIANIQADLCTEIMPFCDSWHSTQMFIRMLFSALVDADRLDAGTFENADLAKLRGNYDDFQQLFAAFEQYMTKFTADTLVNKIRAEILENCLAKAELPPGVFSLNVPTGGGKTLSAMAFALKHLKKYNFQRIVMAIPYNSIIEQTAECYKHIFGEKNVLEHHCNFDFEAYPDSRLAAENWDAPIIVTTTVQLFESLLQGNASGSRKIHNLNRSIIILDEAQKLPPEHLNAILTTLKDLTAHFNCTVVLCSATIPQVEGMLGHNPRYQISGLPPAQNIIDDADLLAEKLRRTNINYLGTLDLDALAKKLNQEPQVLCIVNTRKRCLALFDKITAPNKYHLSALLCPADRSAILAKIRSDLAANKPVTIIATSLIEAGVDIDVQRVYREFTGIDSIAQAAGRCNREGKQDGMGQVFVFKVPEPLPPGLQTFAANATQECLTDDGQLPELSPQLYKQYFQHFYNKCGKLLNGDGFSDKLNTQSDWQYQFREFGQKFFMIDDAGQLPLVVLTCKSAQYIAELKKYGPSRQAFRRLQPFTVNLNKRDVEMFLSYGCAENLYGVTVQTAYGIYNSERGVTLDSDYNF